MRLKILSLVTCAGALLISGCMGKVRYPDYYTLSVPPAPELKGPALRQSATLAVHRFETPAYLRQGRIVYREAPDRIGFYEYHRWASDPASAVTTAVIESLQSTHRFNSVAQFASEQRPDYLLTGRLERLDEIDYEGGVKVEARLRAELTNLRTGAVLWSGDAAATSKIDRHNMDSIVAAMGDAIQTSIQRLLAGMDQQLSEPQVSSR